MELHNQTTERDNWTSFYFRLPGGDSGMGGHRPYFFSRSASAGGGRSHLRVFILHPLSCSSQLRREHGPASNKKWGKWRDYLFGERIYILLSLLAKSALAWQVFGGALRGS